MRRSELEITDPREIARIMSRCRTANVAFSGAAPYVIPLNFGFTLEDGRFALFFHGAGEGEKNRRMRADPRAAFSMVTGETLITGDTACECAMDYESVCGDGTLSIVTGEGKRQGLLALMAQVMPERAAETWTFAPHMLEAVTVMRLDVLHISGKRHATRTRLP